MVIAEVVLTAVDLEIANRHPLMQGFRKMDDYEIYASSEDEAKEYLATLQDLLGGYELTLNQQKTDIQPLPQNIRPSWLRRFRPWERGLKPTQQRIVLMNFFDDIFEAARHEPDTHIVQYAIGMLRHLDIDPENWELVQSLLSQAIVLEPGAIRQACALFSDYADTGMLPDRDLISDLVNQIVTQQAALGHASEVASALQLAIQTDTHLDEDSTEALERCDDDVLACLALDSHARKLLTGFTPPKAWVDFLCQEALNGPHWLLAYEANVNNWIPGCKDYIKGDPGFGFLKSNNVSFYGTPAAHLKPESCASSNKTDVRCFSPSAERGTSTFDTWQYSAL